MPVGFDGTNRDRALLQFSLAGIPSDAHILQATISTPVASQSGTSSSASFVAQAVTRPWTSAVTWNTTNGSTAWTTPGGDVNTTTAADQLPGYTRVLTNSVNNIFDITPLALAWLQGTQANDGIEIRQVGEATNEVMNLYGTSASPYFPSLSIEWTTAPATGGISQGLDSELSAAGGTNGQLSVTGKIFDLSGVGIDLPISYTVGSGANTENAGTSFSFSADNGPAPLRLYGFNVYNGPPNDLTYTSTSGQTYTFVPSGGTSWLSPPGINATMVGTPPSIGTGTYSPITLTFNTGIVDHFSVLNQGNAAYGGLFMTSTTDQRGDTITYNYNTGTPAHSDEVTSIVDTHGHTTTISWTTVGQWDVPHVITDPIGRTATFIYSQGSLASGYVPELVTATDYLGNTTFSRGNTTFPDMVTQISLPQNSDPANITWQTGAYATGYQPQVASISYPITSSTNATYSYTYPSVGQTKITDPNSGISTYSYDDNDNQLNALDPLGHTEAGTWNADNEQLTGTNGLNNVTTNTYDALNNPTKVTAAGGASTSLGYPTPTGTLSDYQPTSSTDSQGNKTTYSYNSMLEVGTATGPAGSGETITNHYQGDPGISCTNALPGELCSSVDGNGNTTSYTYDTAGDPVTETSPQGTVHMTYDGASRMTSRTDQNGNSLYYTYNAGDQLTQVSTSPGGACPTASCYAYAYDYLGYLDVKYTPEGNTVASVGDGGRVYREATPEGISYYSYDSNGNLLTYEDSSGTTTYTYDAANRVTGVAQPGGSCPATPTFPNSTLCIGIGYDNANERTSVSYPNGQTIALGYNTSGQENSIVAKNATGTVIASRAYTYLNSGQAAGLRNTVTDQTGTVTTYGYNTLDELASAATGSTTQSWTYDADGNRLTTAVNGSATSASKYNTADEQCYTATTNTASCATPPSGATTYGYDNDGNLTTSNAATTAYGYSAGFNQQTSTTTNATQTNYTYDDLDNSQRGTAGTTNFTNGLLGTSNQTTAGSGTSFIRDPDGNILAMHTAAGANYYYTPDILGSTILLTDSSDNTAATYTYDAWGNTTATTSPDAGVAAANPWRYDGGYTDPTGLIHFGARYYNPVTGRWTQLDPSGQNAGYVFAGDNPINAVDISGKDFQYIQNLGEFYITQNQGVSVTFLTDGPGTIYGGAAGVQLLPLSGDGYQVGDDINGNGEAVCSSPNGCIGTVNITVDDAIQFYQLNTAGIFSPTANLTILNVAPIIDGGAGGIV